MQREFFEIIREENERGATVLFSSHILSEVQRLCDRLAIIKEGSIIRIDEVSSINTEAYKKFRITADNFTGADLPAGDISDFEQKGNELTFIFRGNIDEMLKLISRHRIIDIQIEEPSLEEIFLHYYE